jgi:predicted Zn-dependent protease with MMP-like domain
MHKRSLAGVNKIPWPPAIHSARQLVIIVVCHGKRQQLAGAAYVNAHTRRRFDEQLEWVLERLPPLIHELIERVPLHVEDYPSDEVVERLHVQYLDDLCGLYTGIPIGEKSVTHSGTLPDVVTIYREGILTAAADRQGRITTKRLRDEIRITILHELAHHHGMTEDELRKLGYG